MPSQAEKTVQEVRQKHGAVEQDLKQKIGDLEAKHDTMVAQKDTALQDLYVRCETA